MNQFVGTQRQSWLTATAIGLLGCNAAFPRHASAQAPAPSVPYVWRNVTIGGGGPVAGLIFNSKRPDLLYARTVGGGAYRWDPANQRWIPLMDWVQPEDG